MPLSSYSPVRTLPPGARVALVSPAGPLRGTDDVVQAIDNVQRMGWDPVVGANVLERDGYLAGSDAQRLDDLNHALQDPEVDAIWCIRGGYGITRILESIDYDALSEHPRAIIGYSDITALHAAVGRECGIITYHAPTARSTMTSFSRASFENALIARRDSCGSAPGARTLLGGKVRGRVMGGNLALIAALTGTAYFPDLRDSLLVLEDVNEPVYRIDRMLQQLFMAGALAEVNAIAFGQCTGCESATGEGDDGRALDDVLREMAEVLNVPCVSGLPIGHVDDQWTLPLGAVATLDADALTLTIED